MAWVQRNGKTPVSTEKRYKTYWKLQTKHEGISQTTDCLHSMAKSKSSQIYSAMFKDKELSRVCQGFMELEGRVSCLVTSPRINWEQQNNQKDIEKGKAKNSLLSPILPFYIFPVLAQSPFSFHSLHIDYFFHMLLASIIPELLPLIKVFTAMM